MPDDEKVLYEVTDGVATVTLNDPEKRNMLSGQMLAELVDAMKAARDSDEVHRAPQARMSAGQSGQ